MNRIPIALSLLCLAACHAPSQDRSKPTPAAAADGATEMDFAAFAGRDMTGVEFLQACQQVSGFNFTYTEATGDALKASSLRLPEGKRIAAAAFQSYLDARLASAGFQCKRIGPEHLRVFLVQRRTT